MNDRIKNIANRINRTNPFIGQLKNETVLLGNEAVTKFAEAIIKECAEHLYDVNGDEFAESLLDHFNIDNDDE